jgi:hypothetical protein
LFDNCNSLHTNACDEHNKHAGSLPLIGVNTFLAGKESHVQGGEIKLMRSTEGKERRHPEVTRFFRTVV